MARLEAKADVFVSKPSKAPTPMDGWLGDGIADRGSSENPAPGENEWSKAVWYLADQMPSKGIAANISRPQSRRHMKGLGLRTEKTPRKISQPEDHRQAQLSVGLHGVRSDRGQKSTTRNANLERLGPWRRTLVGDGVWVCSDQLGQDHERKHA